MVYLSAIGSGREEKCDLRDEEREEELVVGSVVQCD
jgi:hypothetical protein